MTYLLRASTTADALSLAPRLRAADVAELKAAGTCPTSALLRGVRYSRRAVTIEDALGNPRIMAGVTPGTDPLVGHVWLLSDDGITKDLRIPFVRDGMQGVRLFHALFPVLSNEVWAGNTTHIRWLQRMGFIFTATRTRQNGRVFHHFMRLEHV